MKKLTLTLAALGVAATGGVAYAEPSFSVTGMLRQEIANNFCLLYTSPSPRDPNTSRMPSSA